MIFLALILAQKVGQLFVAPVAPTHGETHLQQVETLMQEHHVTNVILMRSTTAQAKAALDRLNPSLVMMDAEWGTSMTITDAPPLTRDDPFTYGRNIGLQCQSLGIDLNFAPVVDLSSSHRSISTDPHITATTALEIVRGMQSTGTRTCAKHFPGIGKSPVDTHESLPILELHPDDLFPFIHLIENGVDAVMIGHVALPEISSLSSSTYNLLRNELNFDGVIITDSLVMGALDTAGSYADRMVQAFLAGADLILANDLFDPIINEEILTKSIPEAIDRITALVESGEVSEGTIDERLRRLERLRRQRVPATTLKEAS